MNATRGGRRAALVMGALTVLGLLLLAPAAALQAAEPLEVRAEDTVRTVLERSVGRRVELVLVSGEKLSGVVARLTAGLVHLEKLSGREFYDALVHIDRIDAVIVRMRER